MRGIKFELKNKRVFSICINLRSRLAKPFTATKGNVLYDAILEIQHNKVQTGFFNVHFKNSIINEENTKEDDPRVESLNVTKSILTFFAKFF